MTFKNILLIFDSHLLNFSDDFMRSSQPDLSNEFVNAIHPFETINLNDSTLIQLISFLQEGKYKDLIIMFYLLLQSLHFI